MPQGVHHQCCVTVASCEGDPPHFETPSPVGSPQHGAERLEAGKATCHMTSAVHIVSHRVVSARCVLALFVYHLHQ